MKPLDEQKINTSRISLNTFLSLSFLVKFIQWSSFYHFVIILTVSELQCMFAPSPHELCVFPQDRVTYFSSHPSKITQVKHCLGSLYCISQPLCRRWTKLVCVWPCSGCRLWPYIVCQVFLLSTMKFPGQTTGTKLFRDSSGIVHKRLVRGVSQQITLSTGL